MTEEPAAPEAADYYAALDVSQNASSADVRRAYHRLALKYHPDKMAPGHTVDAVEFRQIQEAYITLFDPAMRRRYDNKHSNIAREWANYKRDLEDWRIHAAKEAEAEAKQAKARQDEHNRMIWWKGEQEQQRRVEEANETEAHTIYKMSCSWNSPCLGCIQRNARLRDTKLRHIQRPTAEEYTEYLELKATEAQREIEQKQHERQEKDAQMRLAKAHIKEQQTKYLQVLLERGEDGGVQEHGVGLVWVKQEGAAKCPFCDGDIKYISFMCPEGGAVVCNLCKNRLSRFTPPKVDTDHAIGNEETEEI